MAEESSGGPRDARGRFQRKGEDAEHTDAAAEDADAVGEAGDDGPPGAEDGGEEVDISGIPAPSIGPHTKFKLEDPAVRMARSHASDTDAMGKDKRRQVVGQSYGPSVARQATVYGIFLAVTAAFVIGFILLAKELDKPPDSYADESPWSAQGAPQEPPLPLE